MNESSATPRTDAALNKIWRLAAAIFAVILAIVILLGVFVIIDLHNSHRLQIDNATSLHILQTATGPAAVKAQASTLARAEEAILVGRTPDHEMLCELVAHFNLSPQNCGASK